MVISYTNINSDRWYFLPNIIMEKNDLWKLDSNAYK